MARQIVHEFERRFAENHGLKIKFTEAAAEKLVAQAMEQGKSIRDFCAERFKDYQFGLKLVAQNTGREEFTVDVDAVDAPDKVLSDWVVASYKGGKESGDRNLIAGNFENVAKLRGTEKKRGWRTPIICGALVLLTLAVYWPALGNDFVGLRRSGLRHREPACSIGDKQGVGGLGVHDGVCGQLASVDVAFA